MREMPIFDEWLNEFTDEIFEKEIRLKISAWEAAGIRDDAPQNVKDEYAEFLKEEADRRQKAIVDINELRLKDGFPPFNLKPPNFYLIDLV